MEGHNNLILVFLTSTLFVVAANGFSRHLNTTNGHVTLCTPVVCKGEILFCQVNYTSDRCILCPRGKYLLDHLNSSLISIDTDLPKCIEPGPWSCPAEAKLVFDFESTNSTVCECDISRGYYGRNFRLCNQRETECPAGRELSETGDCVTCSLHTFKPSPGYGPCTPKTNCSQLKREILKSGNHTMDRTCGSRLESGAQQIVTTTISSVNHKVNSRKNELKYAVFVPVNESLYERNDVYKKRENIHTLKNNSLRQRNFIKTWPSNVATNFTYSETIEVLLEDMTQKVERYEVISILSITISSILLILIIIICLSKIRKGSVSKGQKRTPETDSKLLPATNTDISAV